MFLNNSDGQVCYLISLRKWWQLWCLLYFICRKGQSSWSDANTRCQNEGDTGLAIITLVKTSFLPHFVPHTIQRYTTHQHHHSNTLLQLHPPWMAFLEKYFHFYSSPEFTTHPKECKWEYCSTDSGHQRFWQSLYRSHRFCHRGEETSTKVELKGSLKNPCKTNHHWYWSFW